jgi:hypothetical protein
MRADPSHDLDAFASRASGPGEDQASRPASASYVVREACLPLWPGRERRRQAL